MQIDVSHLTSVSHKVAAIVVVAGLVVLGIVGLVLPVIPGLLFLVIAAFVAARHFPSLDARLRRHSIFQKHFYGADRYRSLSLGDQLRVAGLLAVKTLFEGFAATVSRVSRYLTRPR